MKEPRHKVMKWSKDDYVKYHVQRLSDVVDKIATTNFNEMGMRVNDQLDDEMHLKVVTDRNKDMSKCIKIVNKLRELVL